MMSPTRRRPSRISRSTTSASSRSAASGRSTSASRARPGGEITAASAPFAWPLAAGAPPPRSHPRRLAARDRVARASWSMASPDRAEASGGAIRARIARQPPGRPRRVGNRRPHRQPQAVAILDHLRQHALLTAMQMRRPASGRSSAPPAALRPPRARTAPPSAASSQEPRLVQGIGGHRQQVGIDRRGIAQGLAHRAGPPPPPRPRQDIRTCAPFRHRPPRPAAPAPHPRATALHALRRQPRKPKRQDAPRRHA